MLPEPTLSFTLPSIHDSTTLDCRVFHPYSLSPSLKAPPWRKHAVVIAHPYAPLGGCYDDHVVEVLTSTLLRLGFLVGTFNFRGAGGSAGRTSWTSKPERSDYMTVAGFIAYYVHFLDPFSHNQPPAGAPESPVPGAATPATLSSEIPASRSQPILLLAGYSYGAMVAAHLPPLAAILGHFKSPEIGSAAADVRLRAQHLAEKQNMILGSARAAAQEKTASPRKAGGSGPGLRVRVGGDEDGAHRNSHDSRRSLSLEEAEERIRRGVGDLMDRVKSPGSQKRRKGEHKPLEAKNIAVGHDGAAESSLPVTRASERAGLEDIGLQRPKAAYLLVSPPQGPTKSLLAMSFSLSNPFSKKSQGRVSGTAHQKPVSGPALAAPAASTHATAESDDSQQELARNPTLMVYGDQDVFMAAKKQRQWARELESVPGSLFRAHEVSTAGHFWIEEGVLNILQDAVRTFGEELLRPSVSPNAEKDG